MQLNNFDDFMNFIASLFTTYYYPVLIGVIVITAIIIFFALKSKLSAINKGPGTDKDKRSEMLLNLIMGDKPEMIKKIKEEAKRREAEKNKSK